MSEQWRWREHVSGWGPMTFPAVGALVVGLVLVACGSSPPGATLMAGAASKTIAAKTANVSMDIKVTRTQAGAAPLEVHADGSFDFGAHRGSLHFGLAGQTFDEVLDGATIYVHAPQLAAALGGKAWLKADLNAIGQASGVGDLGELVGGQSGDPSAGLQFVRGATGAVTEVGHDAIRGVDTTHYRATVDPAKAVAHAPADRQAELRRLFAKSGISSVPVDIWVDGDRLVRRVHMTINEAGPPAEGVDLTLEFYDFGTAVSVAPPPPDQVTDIGQMAVQLKSGQGTGTASAATDALRARLLQTLPAGYLMLVDNVDDTGPSDLDKAVRDDGAADARRVLTADGFVAGYQREWASGRSRSITEFVYQFATTTGATAYAHRAVPLPPGAAAFAVPGVPVARGVCASMGDGPACLVRLTRGDYVGQIVVDGADASPALALSLAQQQFRLFGG